MLQNLIMATAPAAKQQSAAGSGSGFLPLLGPILIFGVMIFFMIRSQKKQAQKRQEMLDRVTKGDRIVTSGGIHATIAEVRDHTYLIEIADNIKVEISKNGVSGVFNSSGEQINTAGK